MIRKATYEDAADIARIHVAVWRTAYAGIVSQDYLAGLSEAKRLTSWQQQLSDDRTVVLVAESGGEIIGWASGGRSRDPDGTHVSEVFAIYILSPHQGRGVGRKLIAEIESLLPESKSTTLWVLQENQAAIRFYEQVGYFSDHETKPIRLGDQEFLEIRYRKIAPAQPIRPT